MSNATGLELDPDAPPVKPTSNWKPSKSAENFHKIAATETLPFRLVAWMLLLASIVYIFIFLRGPVADDQIWILHTKGYLLLAGMHVVLAYLYRRLTDFISLGPSLKQVGAKVPREDAVPVEIKICQNTVVTGMDQGYFWLDESTLYYKGRQTAFRINRKDLPPASLMPRAERPDLNNGRFPKRLTFPVNERNLRLEFKLIDPFEDFSARRRAHQFQIDLATWILDEKPGKIESLLPPVAVHPALLQKSWARFEPLVAGGFLVAANAILTFAILYGYQANNVQTALNHLGAAINVALLFYSAHIAFRAWLTAKIREDLVLEDTRRSL